MFIAVATITYLALVELVKRLVFAPGAAPRPQTLGVEAAAKP
jgi:hypothetical protein